MKRTWVILMLGIAAAVTVAAQTAGGANPAALSGPNVLDYIVNPNSIVFSRTFSEWDAEWQQWAYSIPVADHPLFDNGDCSVGQSGTVWFLGGKFCNNGSPSCSYTAVQRNCKVPHGKYLYFPVANGEDSFLEESTAENPGNIDAQQINAMRQLEDPLTNSPSTEFATIDGVLVPNLMQYSIQSTVFGFTIPYDNYLNVVYSPLTFAPGWYYPAVDQGQYLMLQPLPPGRHTIHFGAQWSSGFKFDVTYFLNVQK